jgi:uncharacterized protein YcfJ
MTAAVMIPSRGHAKGCIKGAVVGGLAGHLVHHGVAGAVAGCVIGHYQAATFAGNFVEYAVLSRHRPRVAGIDPSPRLLKRQLSFPVSMISQW